MAQRETYTIATTGKGKPDYSQEVFRSEQKSGYKLDYNETWKNFTIVLSNISSPFAYVREPLAAEDTVILVDAATGVEMPFDIAAGYSLRIVSDIWSFDRIGQTRFYINDYLTGIGNPDSRGSYYYNIIGALDTATIDPTFSTALTYKASLYNPSEDQEIEGSWTHTCIYKAESTPPLPDTKVVVCKYCGKESTVPREATSHRCPKCGQRTLYLIQPPLGGIR